MSNELLQKLKRRRGKQVGGKLVEFVAQCHVTPLLDPITAHFEHRSHAFTMPQYDDNSHSGGVPSYTVDLTILFQHADAGNSDSDGSSGTPDQNSGSDSRYDDAYFVLHSHTDRSR